MPQTRGQKRKIAALQRLVTLHGMEEDSIQFAATTLSLTYNEMCTELVTPIALTEQTRTAEGAEILLNNLLEIFTENLSWLHKTLVRMVALCVAHPGLKSIVATFRIRQFLERIYTSNHAENGRIKI